MKRQLLTAAGIAGMLLGNMPQDANADLNVNIGVYDRPPISVDVWPDFVYVPDLGFSVARSSQWDMLRYDDHYYVYRDNYWYRASHKRGPWVIVNYDRVPRQIRRHNWGEIRRLRDFEYRRLHDNRWMESAERYDFIYIPALGFSVVIDSPWDIVMYDNYYYVYRDNYWYRASHKRGPWVIVNYDRVPRQIRRYNWGEIRRLRDFEYRKQISCRKLNQGPRIGERRMNEADPKRFESKRAGDNDRRFDEIRRIERNAPDNSFRFGKGATDDNGTKLHSNRKDVQEMNTMKRKGGEKEKGRWNGPDDRKDNRNDDNRANDRENRENDGRWSYESRR
ncbi:MAG: hypothetical protein FJZ79_02385 [Chlorobi bacterium]|nr:hypothetical protein [Chlorobiota bacterium]